MENIDYYKILGVSKDSTEIEIKKEYKKKAKILHPDKNKTDSKKEADRKFQELNDAYNVLIDPKKRNMYDKYGTIGLNNNFIKTRKGTMSQEMEDLLRKMSMDTGDNLFKSVFGFNDPKSNKRCYTSNVKSFKRKGMNSNFRFDAIEVSYKPSFEEILLGKEVKIIISRNNIKKSKTKENKDLSCKYCDGKGIITQTINRGTIELSNNVNCVMCDKTGIDLTCIEKEDFVICFDIPKGAHSGISLAISNKGNERIDGSRGDVVIKIIEPENKNYKRGFKNDPSNITYELDITLAESICGFTKTLKDFDGSEFKIYNKKPINNGHMFLVKKKGLPKMKNPSKRGYLIIYINVILPKSIDYGFKKIIWKSLSETEYEEPQENDDNIELLSCKR